MVKRFSLFLLSLALFFLIAPPASAQSGEAVYIVQTGDTLTSIASRFNVTLDAMIAANPEINPNLLNPGQRIVIPGLDFNGVLETEVITLGDSLRNLRRRTQVADDLLIKLNRLVSPSELYVGVSLILPLQEGQSRYDTPIGVEAGETLLEMAVRQGSDPWTIASINKLQGTWDALPNDVLYMAGGNQPENAAGLPPAFLEASITPLPLVQGGTEVIRVRVKEGYSVSGVFADRPLHFFSVNGEQVALQGVHALLETGVHPLRLEAVSAEGTRQSFEQMVLVASGNYLNETLYVDSATIDPAVTEPENQQVYSLTSVVTSTKYWDGLFTSPAVYPDQYTSLYGTRRTYIGLNSNLTIEGFHTGLDFAGGEGLQIFAPARGQVVFAGPLTVRGNATIIDHGWGVYSGFWHQSAIYVKAGDVVEQGQVIGLVGGTGRVTGAHLHWEVWVNGVQVNPLDWLKQAYP
jgi:murein DD-endopeptidase MepM/ murein hydrolase activator NlpD